LVFRSQKMASGAVHPANGSLVNVGTEGEVFLAG
jgi:hypothetical protein